MFVVDKKQLEKKINCLKRSAVRCAMCQAATNM